MDSLGFGTKRALLESVSTTASSVRDDFQAFKTCRTEVFQVHLRGIDGDRTSSAGTLCEMVALKVAES